MAAPLRLSGIRLDVPTGDSLGAQLQRRRRELKLTRGEAAAHLWTNPKSLMFWERDEREPFVSAYPSIIEYLGYEPWSEPMNLGDALLAERRRRGVDIQVAATLAGVDEGTWRRWERGEWRPMQKKTTSINAILGYSAKDRFPKDVM